MILFKRHLRRVTSKCTATFCFRTKSEYYTFLHRQTERYLGPPYNNIFLIVFLLLIYKNSIFTVMRFEETAVQVYSPVLLGSFSFEAEKSELESSSSELFRRLSPFWKMWIYLRPIDLKLPISMWGVGSWGRGLNSHIVKQMLCITSRTEILF